ncbi:MAG: M16 family metallopeptidase, partial [Gammaproteobacteria bacterium]
YKAWTGPQWGSADANQLQLALRILGGGKNSRLYKRLVYDEQIATDVDMDGLFLEIAGLVLLEASAKPGVELATIEAAIEEEIQLFLKKGPTREELEREQTSIRANFIRGIERIGGMGGKSSVLAEYATYGGSPNLYLQDLEFIASATRKDLQNAAKKWLTPFPYVAEIVPFPAPQAAAEGIDRSVMPDSGTVDSVSFPEFERTQLDNGLEIILARRDAVPVVNMSLSFDAGYAADNPDSPGVASMAMSMLDEGTSRRTALEISQEIAMLGASLGSGANLDNSTVTLSALSETLDAALDVFADVVLNPTFPPEELERLRTNYVVGIQQEKNSPTTMAIRVLPGLLYGEGHSYSQPLTGSGTEESIAAIQRGDLISYHDAWFKPDNAVLIVVGDTTLEEIVPKIETLFGDWKAGATPAKNIAAVEATTPNAIYLVDRPDAEQSVIFAGQLIRPKANPDEVALKAMNDMLGGMTSARINMNLREDKHWSYGARSLILDTQAQRPLLVYAPVQSDKTSESILEIKKELEGIRGDVPPTAAELDRVKRTDTLSLAGRWETGAAVLGSISEIVRFGLPDNYWDTYAEQVNALTLDDVKSIAVDVLRPEDLIWVVVGDREQIETGLRDLNMGEIKLIDADGHALPNNGSESP